MKGHPRKLITLVAEAALENRIVLHLMAQSITGYTITDARGHGSRGNRSAATADSGNVRFEVVCREEVASSIVELLLAEYGRDFSLVVYVSDVTVWRDERF